MLCRKRRRCAYPLEKEKPTFVAGFRKKILFFAVPTISTKFTGLDANRINHIV